MNNIFEKILLSYGYYILKDIYNIAVNTERYEDCKTIKLLFDKYGLNMNELDKDDYVTEFWRIGLSGKTACANYDSYLDSAVTMAGY